MSSGQSEMVLHVQLGEPALTFHF